MPENENAVPNEGGVSSEEAVAGTAREATPAATRQAKRVVKKAAKAAAK